MNVKIKSSSLTSLLGGDYERIFSTLKRQPGEIGSVFAERIPGHEYLLWKLPGEDWIPVTECAPSQKALADAKIREVQNAIINSFGTNASMARLILTIPEEKYAYFRTDANGSVQVCFTGWGYSYPERVQAAPTTAAPVPKGPLENVTISIIQDGRPLPKYRFILNGYPSATGDNGSFFIGKVPVGQTFTVKVDDKDYTYTVESGKGDIKVVLPNTYKPVVTLPTSEEPIPQMPSQGTVHDTTSQQPQAPLGQQPITPAVQEKKPEEKKSSSHSASFKLPQGLMIVLALLILALLLLTFYFCGYLLFEDWRNFLF